MPELLIQHNAPSPDANWYNFSEYAGPPFFVNLIPVIVFSHVYYEIPHPKKYTLTSVKLFVSGKLGFFSAPILTVSIQEVVLGGDFIYRPVGDILATTEGIGGPDVSPFTPPTTLTEFTFSGVTLDHTKAYAIIIDSHEKSFVFWTKDIGYLGIIQDFEWGRSEQIGTVFEVWGTPHPDPLHKPTDPTPEHEETDVVKPEVGDPITPELPLPPDGTVDVRLDLKRVRFKQGGGATGYKIYHNFADAGALVLAATIAATDAANPTVGTPEEYLLTTILAGETVYSWRVDATADEETATGGVWTFTTLRKPEKAVCVSPLDGLLNAPGNCPLAWSDPNAAEVNKATQYRLYFGHTDLFLGHWESLKEKYAGGRVVPRTGVTASAKEVNDGASYLAGSNYAWRVDSYNSAGKTEGDVWEFDVYYRGSADDRPDRPVNPGDPGGDEDDNGGYLDAEITVSGGGRHNSYLVVVGHKKVYIRRA